MKMTGDIEGKFLLGVADQAPEDWDELLQRDPRAEYCQTRHWAESVGRHVPGARILWLTVRRSGVLVAGLHAVAHVSIRKALGVPVKFGHWDCSFEGTSGGPLIDADLTDDSQDTVFSLLVDEVASLRRGAFGSCALVLNPYQEERFGSLMTARPGWARRSTLTAVIPLAGGIDEVEKDRLVNNKRNERNRGMRRGVEFFSTTNENLLGEYFRIYEQAAAHWGVPPNPLGLLKDLLADPDNRVFFTCVRLENRVIGGHLNLDFGGRVLVWNGVTDPAYARKYFPASICIWGDLVESCLRKATWLDLGGSDGLHTLSGFKRYFGAEMQTRGLYIHNSSLLRLLKTCRDSWRKMNGSSSLDRWHDQEDPATAGLVHETS